MSPGTWGIRLGADLEAGRHEGANGRGHRALRSLVTGLDRPRPFVILASRYGRTVQSDCTHHRANTDGDAYHCVPRTCGEEGNGDAGFSLRSAAPRRRRGRSIHPSTTKTEGIVNGTRVPRWAEERAATSGHGRNLPRTGEATWARSRMEARGHPRLPGDAYMVTRTGSYPPRRRRQAPVAGKAMWTRPAILATKQGRREGEATGRIRREDEEESFDSR